MQQRDYVALGLTALVAVGVWSTRKPAAAPKNDAPPANDTNVQQARVLIQTLEQQAQNATPAQREQYAQQLEAYAQPLDIGSPAAAAELRAAAGRIRAGGGTAPPPPPPPPADATLQQARDMILALETQAKNASPGDRQMIATQLDVAANTLQATGQGPSITQAVTELRAAAQRVRNGAAPQPGGGTPPPPPPPPPVNLVQRYDELKAKADAYLVDQTGTVPMDLNTLGAMDRLGADLAASGATNPDSGNLERAQTLVSLATQGYQKLGAARPRAMTL